jgi:voltage-gated potassium channel Kch
MLATINLSQVSELSLVLVALGVALGHLKADISGELAAAFALMAVGSTYAINGSDRLFQFVRPFLTRLGLRETPTRDAVAPGHGGTDIFVLGFFRLASSLVEELTRQEPGLLKRITVVDINPVLHPPLRRRGVRVIYGDLSQRDTLEKAGIEHAKLVLCTLGSWVLKGIALDRLVRNVRALSPDARIVVVAEGVAESRLLFEAGADHVVAPRFLAATEMLATIRAADGGLLAEKRAEFEQTLKGRQEILD